MMRAADQFILLDGVQFTKNDWRNRNRVRTASGPHWLTIPIHTAGRLTQPIAAAEIADPRWARRHRRTLTQSYARMPGLRRRLDDYELIAVIDGCPDESVDVLRALQPRFPRLRIIELSRNFGHHPALWCGLSAARGGLIFLADSDLETPPEVLAELQSALHSGEFEMAYGVAERRAGPWAQRLASALFWRAFNALAGTAIRSGTVTERLMRRDYLDALLTLQERTLFLTGMMDWIGFPTVAVPVPRHPRAGRPSYTWAHRIRLAIDAVTSFSVVPMRLMIGMGAALAGLAMATAVVLICIKLLDRSAIVTGFTAVAVMLLFTLGTLLAALGVLGLYVGNLFLQAKQRPLFIIRREL